MASNKLFEAAAEILAGSKSSAKAMPAEKLAGEVADLGGPTPQNYKSDDNSAKIDTTKVAKSATAPTTNPSDASPDTQLKMNKEEFDLYEGKMAQLSADLRDLSHADFHKQYGNPKSLYAPSNSKKSVQSGDRAKALAHKGVASMKKEEVDFTDDINSIFADDETISEEFKSKVSTIFEARVQDRITQIEEETESLYAGMLEEAVESIKQDLTEKVDDYLSYIVEQWMEENQIAIESGLRSEMTEDFIAGLRNLFAENYIDVPAEKVDLVEELASKVEELESKLDEEIERGVSYARALVESRKSEITREVCEGLTATQVEKIRSLAESVDFSTEEEYQEKLETIRENYFPSGVKKASESHLQEEVTDGSEKRFVSNDPFVSAVANAISKTKI